MCVWKTDEWRTWPRMSTMGFASKSDGPKGGEEKWEYLLANSRGSTWTRRTFVMERNHRKSKTVFVYSCEKRRGVDGCWQHDSRSMYDTAQSILDSRSVDSSACHLQIEDKKDRETLSLDGMNSEGKIIQSNPSSVTSSDSEYASHNFDRSLNLLSFSTISYFSLCPF